MANQNTKKSPDIESALFNSPGDTGMDNLGCLDSSFSLFLLCNKPAKQKFMVYIRLQLYVPPPIQAQFYVFIINHSKFKSVPQ